MKNIAFIVIAACFSISPSLHCQGEDTPRWSHSIAAGAMAIANAYNGLGHDESSINYQLPAVVAFYRLSDNRKTESTCFTFNASYRSASGDYATGGQGGSNSTTATVQWIRADIGAGEILHAGKRKNFGIGFGAYFGGVLFSQGDVTHNVFSGIPYYNVTTKGKPLDVLSPVHVGLNVELRQKIKVTASGNILLGLRFGIETPEGFHSSRFVKQANAYLGFEFAAGRSAK